MYNDTKMLQTWNETGYISISVFSKSEVEEMKTEALRLFNERDPEWNKHGLEGSRPYLNPHEKSVVFDKIMRDKRVVDLSANLIGNDTNTSNCKVDALQTWLYFKPPGELGRDVHQNVFYSNSNWGDAVNVSIAIDDADEENGCLYYYPGSHKEKICYPIPDNLKDEERIKTNPSGWDNERGKPLFIPGTYIDGKWVDKYPKVYTPSKAGVLSVVHSHVLHGSDDNISKDKWRCAFLIGYVKKDSYFRSGELGRKRINVYK